MPRTKPTAVVVVAVALAGLAVSQLVADRHAATQPATRPATQAAGQTFDLKDPKGVNTVVFLVDSELEPFAGTASAISGSVRFDPANPKAFSGKVVIDTASVHTTNPAMTKVLHKPDWLNAEANKQITFTFDEVEAVEMSANGKHVALTVNGKLTIAGVTIDKQVVIKARKIKDGAKRRGGAKRGDLVVLRSIFAIDRTDFGIKPDMGTEKVGPTIKVIASIVGYSK